MTGLAGGPTTDLPGPLAMLPVVGSDPNAFVLRVTASAAAAGHLATSRLPHAGEARHTLAAQGPGPDLRPAVRPDDRPPGAG
ncbi:hypothetical protein FAGKG844_20024 [Frankia sp. AgKG'84/4]